MGWSAVVVGEPNVVAERKVSPCSLVGYVGVNVGVLVCGCYDMP